MYSFLCGSIDIVPASPQVYWGSGTNNFLITSATSLARLYLTPKSVSHLISPYHITPESKNWGKENKGADHPPKKLLIVRQENPGVLPGGFRWDTSGVQRAPPNLAWQDYLSVTGYLFRNAKFPISILVRSLWESHVDARRIPAESQRVAKSFRTGYIFRDPKSTL